MNHLEVVKGGSALLVARVAFRGEGGTFEGNGSLRGGNRPPKSNAPLEGGSAPLVMGVNLREAKVEPLKVMNPLEVIMNLLE
jgi:hypothetical protein